MGAYLTTVAIGSRIPTDALNTIRRIKECDHSFDLAFTYCPYCGIRIREERTLKFEMPGMVGECLIIPIPNTPDESIIGTVAATIVQDDETEYHILLDGVISGIDSVQRALAILDLRFDESKYGVWTWMEYDPSLINW